MVQKVNFSSNNQQTLSEILGTLKMACYPPFECIKPIVQIRPPRDSLFNDHGVYTVRELTEEANIAITHSIYENKWNDLAFHERCAF